MVITAAPLLSKIMNARIAGHAGTGRQLTLVMVNTSMFRHPKYYKELRKLRNKEARVNDHSVSIPAGTGGALCVDPEAGSDQAISTSGSTERSDKRSPGPGQKLQAPSSKPQASSTKLLEPQAASVKPQA